MSEAESLAYCEAAFAEDLQGHPLLSNRSTWFRYTIVKNAQLVLRQRRAAGRRAAYGPSVDRLRHPTGDAGRHRAVRGLAARSATMSQRMLEEFRRIRRPGSDSLQQAAIKSTEWYENLGPKLHLDPISFAYDYLRRSGRVSHAEIQKRDPGPGGGVRAAPPCGREVLNERTIVPRPSSAPCAAIRRSRSAHLLRRRNYERTPMASRRSPRRIFCVGRNYEAHAKEMGVAVDREAPFYFTKAAEHYAPSGSTVPYPPGTSQLSLRAGARRGDRRARVPRRRRPRPRLRVRLCVRARHDPARPAVCRARAAPARGISARTSSNRRCCPRSFRRTEIGHPVRRADRAARQRRDQAELRTSRS